MPNAETDLILAAIANLKQEVTKMSGNLTADLATLTAAITNLGSVVATNEADIQQVLTLLSGSASAANDAAVQAAIASLGTISTALQGGIANMGSVIAPAGPTGATGP